MVDGYGRTGYHSAIGVDLSADYTSDAFDIQRHTSGSLHFLWKDLDAADATVRIEVSNVPDPTDPMWATWEIWTIYRGSEITLFETMCSQGWEIQDLGFRWARVVYTANSVTAGEGAWYFVEKRDS